MRATRFSRSRSPTSTLSPTSVSASAPTFGRWRTGWYDRRIGRAFLDAGVGYGGSCFPKDVAAFIQIARDVGYDFRLLEEAARVNDGQREVLLRHLKDALW